MGVITTGDIAEGASFGPIPRSLTLVDLTLLIGHMTCDTRPDVHTVKLDVNKYSCGSALGEWLPYVRAARHDNERNVQLSLDGGQMYYRVTRAIDSGRELFVWYSVEYARLLSLPPILPDYITDSSTYKCPNCHQTFRYPNCVRAHMRFKCAFKTPVNNNNNTNNNNNCDDNDNYTTGSGVSCKRGLSDIVAPESKRGRFYIANISPRVGRMPTDLYINECNEENSFRRLDSQNLNRTEIVSAFRKVKKNRSDEFRSQPLGAAEQDRTELKGELADVERCRQEVRVAHALYTRHVNAHLLPSLRHDYDTNVLNYVNASKSVAEIQRGTLSSPMKATFIRDDVPEIYSLQERYSGTKAPLPCVSKPLPVVHTVAPLKSMPRAPDKVGFALPPYKARNPVVEAMLHAPYRPVVASNMASANMLQNWCAKCNATFRMTSDLVYHMRSHHHREFDRSRNKDGKLQCDVCGETFRERHHLSRHMTSHM